jgi:hypothetical protein
MSMVLPRTSRHQEGCFRPGQADLVGFEILKGRWVGLIYRFLIAATGLTYRLDGCNFSLSLRNVANDAVEIPASKMRTEIREARNNPTRIRSFAQTVKYPSPVRLVAHGGYQGYTIALWRATDLSWGSHSVAYLLRPLS